MCLYLYKVWFLLNLGSFCSSSALQCWSALGPSTFSTHHGFSVAVPRVLTLVKSVAILWLSTYKTGFLRSTLNNGYFVYSAIWAMHIDYRVVQEGQFLLLLSRSDFFQKAFHLLWEEWKGQRESIHQGPPHTKDSLTSEHMLSLAEERCYNRWTMLSGLRLWHLCHNHGNHDIVLSHWSFPSSFEMVILS